MTKYMTNEEFRNCFTVDVQDFNQIEELFEKKELKSLNEKLTYVKENYDGQVYMHYALRKLNNVILKNYHQVNDEYQFSKDAVDTLLRSYAFTLELVQEGIPEHAYDYIKSKSSVFINELIKQYEMCEETLEY